MSAEHGLVVGPDADGRVVAIGPAGRVVAAPPPGASTLAVPADARILPGQVCAHTHLYSGLAPFGVPGPEPPPETFVQILERLWWRLDRALDRASLEASARWYVAQALLSGTTSLVDHHESPAFVHGSLDVLADACEAVGLRAILCYGATERNGGREEGQAGLAECARLVRDRGGSRLIRGAVALHASFTVSDATCREAGALCRELDTVMHVHMAEAASDVDDAIARGHAGPLERLHDLGALPAGSILAHGVHLTADQVRRCDGEGWWLVQNPRSNEGNQVGYAASLAASDRVALGTDGYPADMGTEEAALQRLGADAGDDPAVLARRLPRGHALMAERFGAATDRLAPGSLGDLRVVDAGGVVHVVVDGKVVVRDRALVAADTAALRTTAESEATRLWAAMRALP